MAKGTENGAKRQGKVKQKRGEQALMSTGATKNQKGTASRNLPKTKGRGYHRNEARV